MNLKKYVKESLKYFLRSYPFIKKYVKEIEELYNMSEEELKLRNEERFLHIFHKAYEKSTFYRNLYSDAGIEITDINSLNDIKKLPVINKDMVKANINGIMTVPKWRLVSAHTSGTTGTPLTVYESWDALWREQAYFYCYRKRCGFKYGESLASLRGNLGKADTTMYVHVAHTLYLSSFNIIPSTVEEYYKALCKYNPKAIEGYPSSLYNLAMAFKDKGLQVRIPICFTSSETLMDFQRSLIEEVFCTQIYDHYGTTERTIRLSEHFDHDGYFEDPGYSINEYGTYGQITTSLINDAFPLIRYETGDEIEMKDIRVWPNFIKRINGRFIDSIVGKDGTLYSDVALTFIFKDVKGVKYAQFIQKEKGHCLLNMVTNDEFTDAGEKHILDLLDEKVGLSNMDFILKKINENEIIYTKRNKFKYVISEIK